jgi:NitT/TauT family transport system permease protein
MTEVDTRPPESAPVELTPPRGNRSGTRSRFSSRAARLAYTIGPPLIVLGLAIGVMYLVSYVLLDDQKQFLLPPPHEVVGEGLLDGANLDEQLTALWDTTQVALVGLAIAFVLGTTFAILMSQAKWVERSFYPYAVIIQTTPILAIVPLVGLWFGFDFTARVVVVTMISLFPIITNTLHGLLTVEAPYHDIFTLNRAGRLKRLIKLELPHAIPDVFVGLRVSGGLAVIGAIVGEFFFRQGSPGIGRLLDVYRAQLRTDLLLSALFWSCLLGLVVFWTVGLVGRRVTRAWHEERRA